MTSTGISIVSLRNKGFPTFSLCLTTWRHLGFMEKLRISRIRRLFANSWGNAAMAFLLSSQFHVCGCECYKLYSGSIVSWEKESGSVAKLGPSNIRFGYCAILTVRKKCAQQQMSVCMSRLAAMRLSIIRSFTLHQTGYRHSIHHVRSND